MLHMITCNYLISLQNIFNQTYFLNDSARLNIRRQSACYSIYLISLRFLGVFNDSAGLSTDIRYCKTILQLFEYLSVDFIGFCV